MLCSKHKHFLGLIQLLAPEITESREAAGLRGASDGSHGHQLPPTQTRKTYAFSIGLDLATTDTTPHETRPTNPSDDGVPTR